MSRINPRLVYWIAGLYDDPDLTAADRDVLTYLGVKRLDFGTGAGYCSIETLVKGTAWSESTVKRALARGQKKSHIERTRRGNRSGDGALVASEWRVLYPSSTGHGRPVEESVGVTGDLSSGLDGSQTGFLQVTPEPPTGSTGVVVARAAAIAAVAEKYGWPAEHASRIANSILDSAMERGTVVTDPVKYVLGSVRRNPQSWAPDARRWRPKGSTSKTAEQTANKAEVAKFRAGLYKQPPCPDGYPGGNLPGPDGKVTCPYCRLKAEEAST